MEELTDAEIRQAYADSIWRLGKNDLERAAKIGMSVSTVQRLRDAERWPYIHVALARAGVVVLPALDVQSQEAA